MNKDTAKFIAEKSKQKLAIVQGSIPIGKIFEGWCKDNDIEYDGNSDEVWFYRGATVKEADKIMSAAQEGNHTQASCSAIHIRVCTEDGKRFFRPHELDVVLGFDPEIVYSIIAYMGGYDAILDDANPDAKELAKNSDSIRKQS